jgi:hypothetical protein
LPLTLRRTIQTSTGENPDRHICRPGDFEKQNEL